MNRAAAIAQAPVLLFLHADCHITTGLLNEMLKAFEAGRAWGCATLAFDNPAIFYRMVSWFSNLRSRLFNSCYGDQAIFCRRDFFEQIGGYPDWPLLEDIEFSRRARLRQRACILSEIVITSTRRFELRGRWYTLSLMQWIKFLSKLGVSPQKLAAIYQGKRSFTCANSSCDDE